MPKRRRPVNHQNVLEVFEQHIDDGDSASDDDGWATTDSEAEDADYLEIMDIRADEELAVAAERGYTVDVQAIPVNGNVWRIFDILWPPEAGEGPDLAAIFAMFSRLGEVAYNLLPGHAVLGAPTCRLQCLVHVEVTVGDDPARVDRYFVLSDREHLKINSHPGVNQAIRPIILENRARYNIDGSRWAEQMRNYFIGNFVDSSDSDFRFEASQWHMLKLVDIRFTAVRMNQTRARGAGSHVPSFDWIAATKCVVNPQNTDEQCLLWCVALALKTGRERAARNNPRFNVTNPTRVSKYTITSGPYQGHPMGHSDTEPLVVPAGMLFPTPPGGTDEDKHVLQQFEEANKIELHIWTADKTPRSVRPQYTSAYYQGGDATLDGWIRVILILQQGHYTWCKNDAGFMRKQLTGHETHVGYCLNCFQVHASERAKEDHYRNGLCKGAGAAICKLPSKDNAFFQPTASEMKASLECDLYVSFDDECFSRPNVKPAAQLCQHDGCDKTATYGIPVAQFCGRHKLDGMEQGQSYRASLTDEDGHMLSGRAFSVSCPSDEIRRCMEQDAPDLFAKLGLHMYPAMDRTKTAMENERAVSRWFFMELLEIAVLRVQWHFETNHAMNMTAADEQRFRAATRCSICRGPMDHAVVAKAQALLPDLQAVAQEVVPLFNTDALDLDWVEGEASVKQSRKAIRALATLVRKVVNAADVADGTDSEEEEEEDGADSEEEAESNTEGDVGEGAGALVVLDAAALATCELFLEQFKVICVLLDKAPVRNHEHLKDGDNPIRGPDGHNCAHSKCNLGATRKRVKLKVLAHYGRIYDFKKLLRHADLAHEVLGDFIDERAAAMGDRIYTHKAGEEHHLNGLTFQEVADGDHVINVMSLKVWLMKYKPRMAITRYICGKAEQRYAIRKETWEKRKTSFTNMLASSSEVVSAITYADLITFQDFAQHRGEGLAVLSGGLTDGRKDRVRAWVKKKFPHLSADQISAVINGKSHFPHGWHNSAAILDVTKSLPGKHAFWDSLKKKAISHQAWGDLEQLYVLLGFENMRKFHDFYLALDVLFLEQVIDQHVSIGWETNHINMLQYYTLPSAGMGDARLMCSANDTLPAMFNAEDHTADDYIQQEEDRTGGKSGALWMRHCRANNKELCTMVLAPSVISMKRPGPMETSETCPMLEYGLNHSSVLSVTSWEAKQVLALEGITDATRRMCAVTGNVHFAAMFQMLWRAVKTDKPTPLGLFTFDQMMLGQVVADDWRAALVPEPIGPEIVVDAEYRLHPDPPVRETHLTRKVMHEWIKFAQSQGVVVPPEMLGATAEICFETADHLQVFAKRVHANLDDFKAAGFLPNHTENRRVWLRLKREEGSMYKRMQDRGVAFKHSKVTPEQMSKLTGLSADDLEGCPYTMKTFFDSGEPIIWLLEIDQVSQYQAAMVQALPYSDLRYEHWESVGDPEEEAARVQQFADEIQAKSQFNALWKEIDLLEQKIALLRKAEPKPGSVAQITMLEHKLETMVTSEVAMLFENIKEDLRGMKASQPRNKGAITELQRLVEWYDPETGVQVHHDLLPPAMDDAEFIGPLTREQHKQQQAGRDYMWENADYPMSFHTRSLDPEELSPVTVEMYKAIGQEVDCVSNRLMMDFTTVRNAATWCHMLGKQLSEGYRMSKPTKIFKCKMKKWLKPVIEKHTANRKIASAAGDDVATDFHKLCANSIYGKLQEAVRRYQKWKIQVCEDTPESIMDQEKRVSHPRYHRASRVSSSVMLMQYNQDTHTLNKLPQTACAILDYAKLDLDNMIFDVKAHMKSVGATARCTRIDTDCSGFIMASDDPSFNPYHELAKMNYANPFLDTTKLPKTDPMHCTTFNKFLGCFAEEQKGVPVLEMILVKAKQYSILTIDMGEKQKAKGVVKSVLKAVASHMHYKTCILGLTKDAIMQKVSADKLVSVHNTIYTMQQERIMLSNTDCKRFALSTTHSLPYGFDPAWAPLWGQDSEKFLRWTDPQAAPASRKRRVSASDGGEAKRHRLDDAAMDT